MLPLHTYQKINPLKTRYIVMKHRSVWKLTEKWRHKINTCLIIKLIRIVLLLIAFQMHSLSILATCCLILKRSQYHPLSDQLLPYYLPWPTTNTEYSDCGCNHSSLLNVCWTSVFGFLLLFLHSLSDHLLALFFFLRS